MDRDRLSAAVLLGAGTGLRTFAGPATLVARGRLRVHPKLRTAIMLAALGELVGDKLPFTPGRTAPLPYLGRVASGGLGGAVVAGPVGALAAGAASAAFTQIGYRARAHLTQVRGLPDLPIALAEDATAYGAARLASAILAP